MDVRESRLGGCLGLILLAIIPGCKRAVDWASPNFNQGTSVAIPSDKIQPYLKTVAVHNFFSTSGIFDALWLSDEVRSAYVDVMTVRLGKNKEQAQLLLRRQLEENKHYITFYVLSEYDVPLADASDWHLFLKINQEIYQPCELKSIDLSPEYRAFFAKRWSKLKTAYVVKFDAQDMNERPILSPSIDSISLCFHSMTKQASLAWQMGAQHTQEVAV